MASSIRTDPNAYTILEKYRQQLIKKGQVSASFSDAIRLMENLIQNASHQPKIDSVHHQPKT